MTNTIIVQTLLIGSSEAFWLSACFSQMMKVVRTRDTKGLSVITTTLYAAGNVAWMTYFFTEHLWLALAGDLLLFLMTIVTVAYMLGNRKQFYRALGSIVINLYAVSVTIAKLTKGTFFFDSHLCWIFLKRNFEVFTYLFINNFFYFI